MQIVPKSCPDPSHVGTISYFQVGRREFRGKQIIFSFYTVGCKCFGLLFAFFICSQSDDSQSALVSAVQDESGLQPEGHCLAFLVNISFKMQMFTFFF